eukprot:scaffold327_cov93-Skeletonema_marinoi.AAC.1
MFIIGCLTLSQLRIISNFVNSTVKFDSTSAENEYKLQYIENEKRKFAAAKGLRVDVSADDVKIPYLDDDAVSVDGAVDGRTNTELPPAMKQSMIIIDDNTSFCGSCMWNNTNINCDDRVDSMMKRYPKENPNREGTKQFILKKGFCIDHNWAPEFIDEDIASVENEVASIFRNHSAHVKADGAANITHSSLLSNSSSSIINNTTNTQQASPPQPPPLSLIPIQNNSTTAIDLVSLTTSKDFFILFNNSAITSWIRHIQNIRSITFIGPPRDHNLFQENMRIHYPHLRVDATTKSSSSSGMLPIRWINETHWRVTYKDRYRCPYIGVCQQLMKLFVFDLGKKLHVDIGTNVLIVDSDTVWSRDVTFVHDDGTVTYFEVNDYQQGADCIDMDPVAFTEGITMGPPPVTKLESNHTTGKRTRRSDNTVQLDTVTPYRACRRAEYPNATGARHIAHHMLFQYDVMMHLHSTIKRAWSLPNIWQAFVKCHKLTKSRVAEYELYYSFVSFHYPERVLLKNLQNGADFMGGSSICNDHEMECCRNQNVLLKGCHNHRIEAMNTAESKVEKFGAMGEMCC